MFKKIMLLAFIAASLLAICGSAACSQGTPVTSPPPAESLTISTTSLPEGQIGIKYSQTLKAEGSGKTSWTVASGSLPDGLSLASTGSINGIPNSAGTFNFTVQVSNGTRTATQALTIKIKPPLPRIDTVSLADGEVGAAYSQSIATSGGSGGNSFAITDGALPAGLALDPGTGAISGTPRADGTFVITVQLKDSSGDSANKTYYLSIKPELKITTTSAIGGDVGAFYDLTFAATGGSGTPTWSIVGGSLPEGLSLSAADGIVYGTPARAGTFTFTFQAIDALGKTTTQQISITINPALTIDTAALPAGKIGQAYSQTLSASGGSGGNKWSIADSALPDGLSLDEKTGTIAGTPKTAGTYVFTVQVSDVVVAVTTKNLSIIVN